MKNHVLRPLWLAIVFVAAILLARYYVVPSDFGVHPGVHGESFTYGFYRQGDIQDWKNFKVKYRGRDLCANCHDKEFAKIKASPHSIIQCENCHGPAIDHPDNPATLKINRTRALCLRCHADLGYPDSNRAQIPGIDPKEHNAGEACVDCHNPHNPDLEDME